jgi:hypothetical protein
MICIDIRVKIDKNWKYFFQFCHVKSVSHISPTARIDGLYLAKIKYKMTLALCLHTFIRYFHKNFYQSNSTHMIRIERVYADFLFNSSVKISDIRVIRGQIFFYENAVHTFSKYKTLFLRKKYQ